MGLTAYRYSLFSMLSGNGFVTPMSVGQTPMDIKRAGRTLPGLLVGAMIFSSPALAQNTDAPSPENDEAASSAEAQPPNNQAPNDTAPLIVDRPLTEFPDFGVDWPDLDAPLSGDSATESLTGEEQLQEIEQTAHDLEMDRRLSGEASGASEDATLRSEAETLAEAAPDADYQPEDTLAERDYIIRFSGLPIGLSKDFDERFEMLSALEKYKGDEANFAQIKRRAETDRELVERLLQIEGYYDATVRNRFAGAEGKAIAVTITVIPGPQYRLDDITLDGLEKAEGDDPQRFREVFGLQSGDVIDSDAIVEARAKLDLAMAENGYAFARTRQPDLVIDHADQSGDLEIIVTPGGKYVFGAITMQNTELFGPDHTALIARFDEGDLYNQPDVEDLRQALIATGLVSTVDIEPVASETRPDVVDLAVNITPAPLRTISGAVGYGTGEGLRTELSWEHRNLFPPEGMIRLAGVVATQEQSGSITFRRNNYGRRDNVLNGQVRLSNIDTAAYDARTFTLSSSIERQSNLIFQKKWNWSFGLELIASQERGVKGTEQTESREIYFIGALPTTLTYDGSDDLLDPTRGFRLSARLAPEASLQSGSFFYVRSQFDGSAYYPASEKIVIAGRARLASITGAGRNRIAPSRRLYSGGGGSVRGFGYQRIGPRDVNNDPAGGRSLVEFSLEARVRLDMFGGNFGIVPFIDAGNVYSASLPDFDGLRYGAGLGVRYYSDFGPIRVDVGTPINPQPGDSRVAVYVSLGQAF